VRFFLSLLYRPLTPPSYSNFFFLSSSSANHENRLPWFSPPLSCRLKFTLSNCTLATVRKPMREMHERAARNDVRKIVHVGLWLPKSYLSFFPLLSSICSPLPVDYRSYSSPLDFFVARSNFSYWSIGHTRLDVFSPYRPSPSLRSDSFRLKKISSSLISLWNRWGISQEFDFHTVILPFGVNFNPKIFGSQTQCFPCICCCSSLFKVISTALQNS